MKLLLLEFMILTLLFHFPLNFFNTAFKVSLQCSLVVYLALNLSILITVDLLNHKLTQI